MSLDLLARGGERTSPEAVRVLAAACRGNRSRRLARRPKPRVRASRDLYAMDRFRALNGVGTSAGGRDSPAGLNCRIVARVR
jgi:hypothetical protein